MNILFVGNSFTYNNEMPSLFGRIAESAGCEVNTDYVAFGGFYLKNYNDAQSDAGKLLLDKLKQNDWDYVVIQEQSRNPITDSADFQINVEKLIKLVREHHAKPVLYQTWAYQNGSKKLESTGLSYRKMYTGLKTAYRTAADKNRCRLAPVGSAFYLCSLVDKNICLYNSEDNYHPSLQGSYLAACVIFYKIFGSRKAVTFSGGLDKRQASVLRFTARLCVFSYVDKKSIIYRALTAVFAVVFIISLYKVADYYIQANKSAVGFERLYGMIITENVNEDTQITASQKYAALYEQNSDFAGWISIDGTNINYPVMFAPDRKDFYLRRDFEKKYSYYGTPYIAEACEIDVSDNTIIYGHNMRNGTMFSALEKYLSEDFFKNNRYIRFDTMNDYGTYEILSVFKVEAVMGEFDYYNFINASTQAEYDDFIATCKSYSLYDTGVTAQYGEKLITLSTCEYSSENGRLVVVAKKV